MESERHLHIVSFDLPYPPSYGGVIDVFYKIESLARSGIKIHLHAFHHKSKSLKNPLEQLCHEVYLYPRKFLLNPFNREIPMMVQSRSSDSLLKNLLKDDYPVIFEGIHCTALLDHPELSGRLRVVRMHNIEFLYYKNLARVENRIIKKYYLGIEAKRLKNYEKILKSAGLVAAISPADHSFLSSKFNNSFYLPVFHPNRQIISKTGKGEYLLYHGNLEIAENNEAAMFLVNEVFNEIDLPLVIAGSNPSHLLKKAVSGRENIRLLSDITTDEIYDLLVNAQINLLPTFQNTGIKLKLINSLFQGRYCIANSKMVKNTGLEHLCILAESPENFRQSILENFDRPFTREEIDRRQPMALRNFNNQLNANLLINKIFKSETSNG